MNLKTSLTAVRSKVVQRVMGGLFAVMAGVVVVNEGSSEKAYQDSAGVWTICHGETKGVKKGDTATPMECSAQLATSLQEHAGALEGLSSSTPDAVLVGSVDMAYNVGVYGFRGSKVKRLLMQQDYTGAGKAVLEWRYISRYQVKNPGANWVQTGPGKWRYDCSTLVHGKRNTVCWGLWQRRQWQAKAIGNQFSSATEALDALKKV